MSEAGTPTLVDRFVGSLLGLLVGDAACAPYEGVPATAIWYDFGGARKILGRRPEETLRYTDDTQMAIAVTETLVANGRIVEADLVGRFAELFDEGRGYGPGARRVIEAMRRGEDWRTLAVTQFPGGSLGNGAAMRVAAVGLMFRDDLDRVAEEARLSALPTHTHPVGIDGACVLATAVALASRADRLEARAFYKVLIARARTAEFREQLARAAELGPTDTVAIFGNSLEADRSVTTAVACFTTSPESYLTTVATALCLGGDVDTVAAMAGAISGAYLGSGAIPAHLLEAVENGYQGRDYVRELAQALYDRYRREHGGGD